jgi:hypothetical protein
MTELELEKLFSDFLASSRRAASLDNVPSSQASLLVSMVAETAPVFASEWNLPRKRSGLKERIENETVESDDIDAPFAAAMAVTLCGYFLAEFYFTGKFESDTVDFAQLKSTFDSNREIPIETFLTSDLAALVAKCRSQLTDGYCRDDHLSEILKGGRIKRESVEDLIGKTILGGVYVRQISEIVRQGAN